MPISPIISTGDLAGLLSAANLRLIDCRYDLAKPEAGRAGYLQAHLPGAIFADLKHDLASPVTPTSSRHPLPDAADFVQTLAGWGISPDVHVVVYDGGGGGFAGRLWWMLRAVGHSNVQLLDGGLAKWQRENRPLSSGEESAAPGAQIYPAQFNPEMFVSAAQVLAITNDPAWRLIDARAAERFSGATEPIDPIAGHIPSALNRFHGLNLTPEGIFKPADQLREEFAALLDGAPADHAIVYCGSGVTSCHHLIALELAGLPGALLYPGSWSEWIRDPARPLARS